MFLIHSLFLNHTLFVDYSAKISFQSFYYIFRNKYGKPLTHDFYSLCMRSIVSYGNQVVRNIFEDNTLYKQ